MTSSVPEGFAAHAPLCLPGSGVSGKKFRPAHGLTIAARTSKRETVTPRGTIFLGKRFQNSNHMGPSAKTRFHGPN
jgi:hypothetical protein